MLILVLRLVVSSLVFLAFMFFKIQEKKMSCSCLCMSVDVTGESIPSASDG